MLGSYLLASNVAELKAGPELLSLSWVFRAHTRVDTGVAFSLARAPQAFPSSASPKHNIQEYSP